MEIPVWLLPHLPTTCDCGGVFINNEALTERYCSNGYCPHHMAMKLDSCLKYLGVKGVGPATCLETVEDYNLHYHLDGLKYFISYKPKLELWEVGKLAMVKGYDKELKDPCHGFSSFKEAASSPDAPLWFIRISPLLGLAEPYFEIKKPRVGRIINVMMTGSIHGFDTRDQFIAWLNEKYGDYFVFYNVGKRKSNVHFLIAEPEAGFHSKMQLAQDNGISIVSSAQLVATIEQFIKDLGDGQQ